MEYLVGDYGEFSPFENANVNNNNNVNFAVDDLFNFSKEDETMTDVFFEASSAAVTPVDSCNSSVGDGSDGQFNGNVSCRSFNDSQFSGNELCVPYDDLAELEWLSNFVEESFSNEDLHFIPTDTSSSIAAANSHAPVFPSDVSVPGKARSKRSRAAPCDWSSRLLVLKTTPSVKQQREQAPTETPTRRCLHCASEKTPQWRTGPLGPKTLCNACGVRYKSGRLVPEYRPASSPTFVSAKHSNSHRKVMELRRQKEVQHSQLMGRGAVYNGCDEFMIRGRGGINDQDLRRMV